MGAQSAQSIAWLLLLLCFGNKLYPSSWARFTTTATMGVMALVSHEDAVKGILVVCSAVGKLQKETLKESMAIVPRAI